MVFGFGCSPDFNTAVNTQIQVTTWLIYGIEAHICVYQTALYLQKLGYGMQVITDYIVSRTQDNKALAIQRLANENIKLTGLEMCSYELLGSSEHLVFKKILALIK